MIRQFWWGMGQFCASCQARGEAFEDCWWPINDEFWYRRYQGTRLTHWTTKCRACTLEDQAARDHARRYKEAA